MSMLAERPLVTRVLRTIADQHLTNTGRCRNRLFDNRAKLGSMNYLI